MSITRAANGNGRFKFGLSVVIQIVAWVAGVVLAYGALNSRLAVVESWRDTADKRLERIEQKIDTLLQRR